MTEPLALHTVLVPIDFSQTSRRALDLARDLARTAGPARLVLVHATFIPVEVEALVGSAAWEAIEEVDQRAAAELDRLVEELQRDGIAAERLTLRGSPEHVILDAAAAQKADLIVMGTHGRTGLAHVFLGSVAERVVREALCPVLTVRPSSGSTP